MKRLLVYANYIRFLLCWNLYKMSSQNLQGLITADFVRWMKILRRKEVERVRMYDFIDLLLFFPQFRSLVYSRLRMEGAYATKICGLFAPPLPLLDIDSKKIGGGDFYPAWICNNHCTTLNRQELLGVPRCNHRIYQ